MIVFSTSEAQQNFDAMLDAAAKQTVVLRTSNRDVAMVISPEQYARLHQLNVEKLLNLCDRTGKEAVANGLTDEILAELLARDD